MQLSDWLLVEVALLLIGLTKISFVKNWLGLLGRDQLSFRLSALDGAQDREFAANRSPSPTLKGLSHEMDLAFEDMHGQF
jgi:hypothetical protein